MGKVIIGIHGLRNKPEPKLLETWWKEAIQEGLVAQKSGISDITFRLVYWADLLYKTPLHEDTNYSHDERYNQQPYQSLAVQGQDPKPPEYKDSVADRIKQQVGNTLDKGLDFLSQELGVTKVSDAVLTELFSEMSFYYSHFEKNDSKKKMVVDNGEEKTLLRGVRDRLKSALLAHQGEEILLAAHSMGTLISYDTLRELEAEQSTLNIGHYITFGAPLGLYFVKARIDAEWGGIQTPENVKKRWSNYSDKKDKVAALDPHLADDYQPNSQGIRVKDDLIANTYINPTTKEINRHSEWGYLRTPEMARQFKEFLG